MNAAASSGRRSGRVASGDASDLLMAGQKAISGNDSLAAPAAVRRVGAVQAERVIAGLSPLERDIVTSLGRVRLASGRQLQRLHFPPTLSGQRQARRVLTGLTDRRVLARLGRSIGGRRAGSAGFVYSLDIIGLRLLRPDGAWRRPWAVGQSFVAHAVAVAECYAQLVEGGRDGRWRLLDFQAEPACWRRFAGPRGRHSTLKPDAFAAVVIGRFEDRWYLGVDRATEDLGRIQRKARTYLDYWHTGREAVFPRVLWVTIRPARQAALARALCDLPAEGRALFRVCIAEQFADVIAAGADAENIDQQVTGGGEG